MTTQINKILHSGLLIMQSQQGLFDNRNLSTVIDNNCLLLAKKYLTEVKVNYISLLEAN